MNRRNRDRNGDDGLLYRLEVQGTIRQEWSRWFGADTLTPAGANTVIHVRVRDQAELFGRLRRIHDLNLLLVSVQSLDDFDPSPTPDGRDSSDHRRRR